MTNDELDELMIKAGLRFGYPFARSHLVTFSKLVAAKERERCAMVCEDIYTNGDFVGGWVKVAANKIRSLK